MKRLLILFLLLACFVLPVFAAEGDPVEIDPVTGEPISETTDSEDSDDPQENKNRVLINDITQYDFEKRMFIINQGNVAVYSSVANGMITNQPVTIGVGEGFYAELYCDSISVEGNRTFDVSNAGSYVFLSHAGNDFGKESIHFDIVNPEASSISDYWLPSGFSFVSVTLDGEPIEYESNHVSFEAEGYYELRYLCSGNGITYNLEAIIDHTAPTLALEAVVDGVAAGPVDISDVEPGAILYIELDGQQISYSSELSTVGHYRVYISDAAGNATEYRFKIAFYFNFSAVFFLILLIALVVGLILYLIVSRKRLRIR